MAVASVRDLRNRSDVRRRLDEESDRREAEQEAEDQRILEQLTAQERVEAAARSERMAWESMDILPGSVR